MPHGIVELVAGWRFHEGFSLGFVRPDFDDSTWKEVELPHDWSIEHEFSPDVPGYCRAAYLPKGKGVYRRQLKIPQEMEGLHLLLAFDGVYRNAKVYVNGREAGGHPWGYIPFDVTLDGLVEYGRENLIAVTVDNAPEPGARWYTGAGIYRKVRLESYGEMAFVPGGIAVATSEIGSESALLTINYELNNFMSKRGACETEHRIVEASGEVKARSRKRHFIGAGLKVQLRDHIELPQPGLWSLESPGLYTLESEVVIDGKPSDKQTTRFGVREIVVSPERGLLVNGAPVKLKGVCLHNDGGLLGVACGKRTFARQIAILKGMGCNAIRTAHHPFSPEFLDVCDEKGILVMAEAFDE